MSRKNIYQGDVEQWVVGFLFDAVGLNYNEDDYTYYGLSDCIGIITGKKEKLVIVIEKVKISTYFGYAITLNYLANTRKIFTLEIEQYEGEEGYRAELYNKAYTNAFSVWKKTFQGLRAWPR